MTMHYDLTLKQIFHSIPQRLLKILTGRLGIEILNGEYPSVKKRQPDLVFRLEDNSLFHIEIQSDHDETMAWRMLEYYQLIYRHYHVAPAQMVLYVGNPRCQMLNSILHTSLSYSFQVLDIRTIDSEILLESSAIEENLLALLAKVNDEHTLLQKLTHKISGLDINLSEDYFKQLNILAGLRPQIKRELDTMPIQVRVEDTPFYTRAKREGRAEGERIGKIEGEYILMLRMLQKRFGELPQKVIERLKAADCDRLEQWAMLLLSAKTLDEIFEE